MKQLIIITTYLLFSAFLVSKVFAANSNFQQEIYPLTECNDGIDNDWDGGIDFATDSECTSWIDTSESDIPVSSPVFLPVPPVIVPQVNPTSQNIGTIIQDNVATFISTTVPKAVQKFFWEPLGLILGINENESTASSLDVNNAKSLVFVGGMIYFVVIVISLFAFSVFIFRKDENTINK